MRPKGRYPSAPEAVRAWVSDAQRIDQAVYETIAVTPTPSLDNQMRILSNAANNSRLWIATAAALPWWVAGQVAKLPRRD